ncbi:MAG: PEPxxWA-CTERM sorting domain-containing protein [Caulobacterales bacterium]|jgi:hypothetical protein
MKCGFLAGAVAALAVGMAASAANASTIVDDFTFFDSSAHAVASGSFSYDSSLSGTIGFGDLSAFSIDLLGGSFDLAYVNSVASSGGYQYFGYDIAGNTFVPASVTGNANPPVNSDILSATGSNVASGFFFDPIPGQADPAGTGADGVVANFSTGRIATVASLSIAQAGAVPEPASWALMLIGFGGLGAVLRQQRARPQFATA